MLSIIEIAEDTHAEMDKIPGRIEERIYRKGAKAAEDREG